MLFSTHCFLLQPADPALTSPRAHTVTQDSERSSARSSKNFYLHTILAITTLPFGHNGKRNPTELQTCSVINTTLFQLIL